MPDELVETNMMCATSVGDGVSRLLKGPCYGDEGSPLIWEDNNDYKRAYLVGISIYVVSKCEKDTITPTVYTFVPRILEWILSVAGPSIQKCTRVYLPGGGLTTTTQDPDEYYYYYYK